MASQIIDFQEKWKELEAGLETVIRLFQGRAEGVNMDYKLYMSYYHLVYNWFISPDESKKRELYDNISNFFMRIATEEKDVLISLSGDALLVDYLKRFHHYKLAGDRDKNICVYMHRYWIPGQKTSGETVYDIDVLALVQWREFCYEALKYKIRQAMLDLVERGRNGQMIDKTLLRNMVETFIALGVKDDNHLQFYKNEFEEPFLVKTRQYYTLESDEYLAQNSVIDYMKKAETRLTEEEELAKQYLQNTKDELVKCCEDVLIKNHISDLQSEFQRMLNDDKKEDMKRFFSLLSRIENGLNQSADTLREYLINAGTNIVNQHAEKLKSKAALKNSIELINRIIELHDKYSNVIKECFSDHKLFVQAMDEAFTKFVNLDIGVFTMSELLNFYVDHLLKGNEKLAEDKMEERSEACVRIFTYFDDKDFFYASFRKSLSKRLLSKKNNEDAERNFIAKLKRRHGDVYTKKLEGMFNDIANANDSAFQEFAKNLPEPLKIDFSVLVLNDKFWPLSKQTELKLAPELIPCIKAYETFYSSTNEKKRLTWIYSQGGCNVQYTFMDPKKQKYKKVELGISVMQTCILLMFNESERFTFEEIRQNLGLSTQMLRFAISPLIISKTRILVDRGTPGNPKDINELKTKGGDAIKPEDYIQVIPLRKVQRRKIQFPPGAKIQMTVDESKKMKKRAMEERAIKTDLALVRVMKSRNSLLLNDLISEASAQLLKFFKPDPRSMKKRIEALMERGFMKRDEENQRLIHYCA